MSKRRRRSKQRRPREQPEAERERAQASPGESVPRFGVWMLGVFLVALIFRLLHLWQIAPAPFFELKLGDTLTYDVWARTVAGGDWLGSEVFYQAPLYPYFLGMLYATVGDDPLVLRLCQAVVSSFSCVLVGLAGARFFSHRVGIVAGAILALYAPSIFLDSVLQKSVLDLFFLGLCLWLLGLLASQPRPALWVALGSAIGCLILARENALVLTLPILAWIVLGQRGTRRVRLAFAALFLTGLAAVLLPVALRNRAVGGEFHLTTSQFGPNFYIGNHDGADGTYRPLIPDRGDARYERLDAMRLAEQASGRRMTAGEVSRYWTGRAFDFITSQPGQWLGLMARKFRLLWNAVELADTEDQYTYAEWSIPLLLTGYVGHFGLLVPLAVLGIWVTRESLERLWVLHAMLIVYAGSVIVFFVFARYRYPLVPLLVLFAAAGLSGLTRFVRSSPRPQLVVVGALFFGAALFCSLPAVSTDAMRAVTRTNIGTALAEQGRADEAMAFHEQAVAIRPDSARAQNDLGVALQNQGRIEEAIRHYRQAIELDPVQFKAHNNLGGALQTQGKIEEAIRHHRRALEIRPGYAEAHLNLGTALQRLGRNAEAIDRIREAIGLEPGNPVAHRNLGLVLARNGQTAEAIAELKTALDLRPDDPETPFYLSQLLRPEGRLTEAVGYLRQAVRLDPARLPFRNALGKALAQSGDLQGAIEQFEAGLELDPQHAELRRNLAMARAAVARRDRQ